MFWKTIFDKFTIVWPFRVKEKEDALKLSTDSLEEKKQELEKFKEEADKLKKKNNVGLCLIVKLLLLLIYFLNCQELRERNWKAMDAVSALEKSVNDKVREEKVKKKMVFFYSQIVKLPVLSS